MMVEFKVKLLETARESQIKEAANIYKNAFYGDIANNAFLGGNWDLLQEFSLAMLRASLLEGVVYIVTIGQESEEQIVSVGYWFGHGIQLFGSEKQRAVGFNEFFEKLSPETQHWWTVTYLNESTQLDKSCFNETEIAKRWYCYCLATAPEHQGNGYATAIVNEMFKRAVENNTFIGLATDSDLNVSKYLAMGFKKRGGGSLTAPTGDFYVHFLSKGELPEP